MKNIARKNIKWMPHYDGPGVILGTALGIALGLGILMVLGLMTGLTVAVWSMVLSGF